MNDMRATSTVTTLTPPARRSRDGHDERVKVRPLPKFVFLYPMFLASVVLGLIVYGFPQLGESCALIFLSITFLNFIALALDFRTGSLLASVALVFAVGAVLLLVQLNVRSIFPDMLDFGSNLNPAANAAFYFTLAIGMGLLFAMIWLIDVRFNYWEVMRNEIVHQHGFLDSVTRYPAPGTMVQKDIVDMFEYALLRSGRLTLHPTRGPDIVLENVPNIHRIEDRIQRLLGSTSVTISDPSAHDHQEYT